MKKLRVYLALVIVIFAGSLAYGDATEDLFRAIQNHSLTVKQFNALRKRGGSVKAKDQNQLTPLMWAIALQYDTKIISAMIKAGADVNARGEDENTPLMNAAFGRAVQRYGYYGSDRVKVQMRPDVARLLIKSGARVNDKNSDGNTPLICALYRARPEVIKILLNSRANVNARDNGGYTALMYAASENNIEVVRTLLDAGANPNIQENKYGLTALMRAQNPQIASLLVRYGADIYLEDYDGRNVLEYSISDELRAAIVNSVR